jgi:hypothetical protein
MLAELVLAEDLRTLDKSQLVVRCDGLEGSSPLNLRLIRRRRPLLQVGTDDARQLSKSTAVKVPETLWVVRTAESA